MADTELFKVFVYDLETTDLNTGQARILEIAVAECDFTLEQCASSQAFLFKMAKDQSVDQLGESLGNFTLGARTGKGRNNPTKQPQLRSHPTAKTKNDCPLDDIPAVSATMQPLPPFAWCGSKLDILINPGQSFTSMDIHKITMKIVAGRPLFSRVWPQVVQFIENATPIGAVPVLIAHNGKRYDEAVLAAEVKRHSVSVPNHWLFGDSLALCQEVFPKTSDGSRRTRFSMESLCQALNVTNETAHNGLSDIKALNQILWKAAQVYERNKSKPFAVWIKANCLPMPISAAPRDLGPANDPDPETDIDDTDHTDKFAEFLDVERETYTYNEGCDDPWTVTSLFFKYGSMVYDRFLPCGRPRCLAYARSKGRQCRREAVDGTPHCDLPSHADNIDYYTSNDDYDDPWEEGSLFFKYGSLVYDRFLPSGAPRCLAYARSQGRQCRREAMDGYPYCDLQHHADYVECGEWGSDYESDSDSTEDF